MRLRKSGMPKDAYWPSLFDAPQILVRLTINQFNDAMAFGYGAFTVPMAKLVVGIL